MPFAPDQFFSTWPFRPRPVEDETFSSWFSRLAWSNGLTPSELYRIALPGARMHRLDLDRHACEDLIAALASKTGFDTNDLERRTFRRWIGRLIEDCQGREKLPWLPPAGTSLKSRSYGQQACPRCLAEEDVPHLRQKHRLAFITACPNHGVLLIDRCPNCSAPIQPLYVPGTPSTVTCCWNCGSDFRQAESEPDPISQAQAILLETANQNWGMLGRYGAVHSLAYFRILWSIYRLLATGRFAYPLRTWVAGNLLGRDTPAAAIPRFKEIERLNPRCRGALIEYTTALMADWPEPFVAACKAVGISSRVLIKNPSEAPFALWESVHTRLTAPSSGVTEAEAEAARRFLEERGRPGTRRALVELTGTKSATLVRLAVPAASHQTYGTHRYWKLDGVSTDVRASAKAAAHRSGENVGAWVDRILRCELQKINLI